MKKLFVLIALFIVSCASGEKSIYRISHEHLERDLQYISRGIYVHTDYWIELIDDKKTIYYWDEAVIKTISEGVPTYVDIVQTDGSIYRFRPNYDNQNKADGFAFLKILTFKDGRQMNSFQYWYIVTVLNTIPR